MVNKNYSLSFITVITILAATSLDLKAMQQESERRWLAGDHHIHSRYSVGWDNDSTPPAPIIAGDAIYLIPMNALMQNGMACPGWYQPTTGDLITVKLIWN